MRIAMHHPATKDAVFLSLAVLAACSARTATDDGPYDAGYESAISGDANTDAGGPGSGDAHADASVPAAGTLLKSEGSGTCPQVPTPGFDCTPHYNLRCTYAAPSAQCAADTVVYACVCPGCLGCKCNWDEHKTPGCK
jgi:hypothetical protein